MSNFRTSIIQAASKCAMKEPCGVEMDPTDKSFPKAMKESEPATQDSPLLGLPLEVLQTITWYMDVGTFFASLLTCKQVFEAAKCRPNLLRHLYNLPGLRLGLDDVSISDKLLQFRRRAAANGCAAGVLADVTTFSQTSRTSLSNAAFSPRGSSQAGRPNFLATAHEGGFVHVYDLGEHHVRLESVLHIPSEDGNTHTMEVSRLAFGPDSHDLAVLYRDIPENRPPGGCLYKLVTFHYVHTSDPGSSYDSDLLETRDITRPDIEVPVGLALASNGRACIAWKVLGKENKTKVTLIGWDETLMRACGYGQYLCFVR